MLVKYTSFLPINAAFRSVDDPTCARSIILGKENIVTANPRDLERHRVVWYFDRCDYI